MVPLGINPCTRTVEELHVKAGEQQPHVTRREGTLSSMFKPGPIVPRDKRLHDGGMGTEGRSFFSASSARTSSDRRGPAFPVPLGGVVDRPAQRPSL